MLWQAKAAVWLEVSKALLLEKKLNFKKGGTNYLISFLRVKILLKRYYQQLFRIEAAQIY